jgi:hypothetical protein
MRVKICLILLFILGGMSVWATEFKLNNGDVIKGDIAAVAEEGLTIRLDLGGFSERISWTKFTQETLKLLANDPKCRAFVEPFIEVPIELKARNRPKKREFKPMPVQRVALPAEKGGFLATATLPANLAILGLLFAANLFAAYEIAVYRGRPVALVCGMSVILPVVTPVLFLSLPSVEPAEVEEGGGVATEFESKRRDTTRVPGGAAAGGLTMAKSEKSTAGSLEPVIYKRGETTFNRRFFETKFAGFFRVVLGEKEKQMIIVVKTSRDEFVARRIARITGNEMHIQLLNGSESPVSFGDIAQVQLKPKED